ncbi:hypothetical protein D3C87_1868320 [compost metagenome]
MRFDRIEGPPSKVCGQADGIDDVRLVAGVVQGCIPCRCKYLVATRLQIGKQALSDKTAGAEERELHERYPRVRNGFPPLIE